MEIQGNTFEPNQNLPPHKLSLSKKENLEIFLTRLFYLFPSVNVQEIQKASKT